MPTRAHCPGARLARAAQDGVQVERERFLRCVDAHHDFDLDVPRIQTLQREVKDPALRQVVLVHYTADVPHFQARALRR